MIKTTLALCLAVSTSAFAQTALPADLPHGTTTATVGVCFRPNDSAGCVQHIVAAINSAKTEIRVQAYNFTTIAILSALADAKKRGVDVEVILDKTNAPASGAQGRYTGATYMVNSDVPTYIDRKPQIAHNKLIIIDQHLVVGGSYNYSNNAEAHNAENVTFMDSPISAKWFLDNWYTRRSISEVFKKPIVQ